MSEWISVKERLPESGQAVLCFWKSILGSLVGGDNYGVAKYEDGGWVSADEFSEDDSYVPPIAWMSLPQPPKGE